MFQRYEGVVLTDHSHRQYRVCDGRVRCEGHLSPCCCENEYHQCSAHRGNKALSEYRSYSFPFIAIALLFAMNFNQCDNQIIILANIQLAYWTFQKHVVYVVNDSLFIIHHCGQESQVSSSGSSISESGSSSGMCTLPLSF